MKSILSFVLLFSVFVVSAGTIFGFSYSHNAYAVTGTISDGASCVAILPGSTWISSQNQCIPNGVTINPGETLTIANGVTLNVQSPGITNQGTIINDGILYYLGFTNHGNFINHGQSGGQGWHDFVNWGDGSISNDGTLSFTGSEAFRNYGTIDNLPAGKMYQNYGNRDINNYNMFQNDGTMYLGYSQFYNNAGSTLLNNGQIQEGGDYNAFHNNGGILTNTNTGNFTTINGYAYFASGTVTNNGYMATISENGNNYEGFFMTGGTFTNNANGLIVNDQVINNGLGSSLTNDGVVRNECGSTYIGNEPTPNPTVHVVCPTATISSSGSTVGSPIGLTANVVGGVPPFSYSWNFILPPSGSTATFSNPTSVTPSFTPDLPGNYWIGVTITDSEFARQTIGAQVTIPVTSAPIDKTAPVVTVPTPITASATGPSGAVVTFTTSATDPDDAAGPVTCDHASGSTFPIGTTTVTCTSTDTHSNTGTASFTVTVKDMTPPVVSVTSPTNGATVPSSSVAITGTSSSSSSTISNVQVSIDGASYVTATGTTSWSYTVTGLASGLHSITAKATDSQGLIGYSTNVVASSGVPIGNGGQELAFDPDNGNIYVSNYNPSYNVVVVSGSTNQVLATISDSGGPTGIAYDSVNHYVYTANYNAGTVTMVNTANNQVVGSIPVGANPFGVAYVPNGDIYVANTGSNTVSVINPSTNTVVGTISTGVHPQDFTYDSTHNLLYMTNQGSNNVSVINPSTNTVVNTINVGNSPRGLAYDPANGKIYVANYGSNTVSIIDTSNNNVSSIPTGSSGGPNGVAFDPVNGFVYVPDFSSTTSRLNVIDTSTDTFINPVTLPSASYYYYAIFDPINSDIYITSGSNVAIIQTQTQFTVQDTTAPVVTVPSPITASATSPSGATVTFTTSATDPDDAAGPVTCDHASGSTFPIGTTTVTCTSTDTHSNTGTASFTVTVKDTTAPVVTVPSSITVPPTSPSGATVTFTTSATDPDDAAGPVTCDHASGSTFPIGTTTVTCTSTDTHSNTGTASFTATVQTPLQALQSLITVKENMGLPHGTTTSLDAKLTAASDSLNSGDGKTAKNQLNAFISEVNAQTGKKITQAQANQLISGAQNIINSIQ